MSADRAETLGLTRADITEALADTPADEPADDSYESRPGWDAIPIGGLGIPAAHLAFGSGR